VSGGVRVEIFEAQRGRLFGIAYRILGSVADAEDVVQETWLACQGATEVSDPVAYLTTAAGRRALNRARDIGRRREDYVGPWLPEPLSTEPGPAETVELAESVTMAMLVMLDAMSPLERAAFVLCEVFEMPAPQAAAALDRSPEAVRQLVSRARRHARDHGPQVRDVAVHRRAVTAFAAALGSGDLPAVIAVLAPDVEFVSDGGGSARAALRPVHGAEHVARLLLGLARQDPGAVSVPAWFNGLPGFLVTTSDGLRSVLQVDAPDGVVRRIWFVRNPQKLAGVRSAPA
jgi:RNA polymerase sigma factor (sigma-70 family)